MARPLRSDCRPSKELFLRRLEGHCHRVHAKPLPGGSWSIVEHMTQVPPATRASDFRADVAEAPIDHIVHRRLFDRRPKARPAGTRFELGLGGKELEAASCADIRSFRVVVPILTGKRPLRPLFP